MRLPIVVTLALSYFLMGCGGTDSVGTGPTSEPQPSSPSGTDPAINTLVFSGAASELYTGESVNVTVTALTADGHIANNGAVAWKTSDPGIVSIKSTGDRTATLTAVALGSAVIFANIGETANSVGVRVTNEIAGQTEGTTGSFIYSVEAGMEFLRIPVGSTAIKAAAINDAGQVVGAVTHRNGSTHAFNWSRATGVVEFLDDGLTSSEATAISTDGQIAGIIFRPDGMHCFIWSTQRGMRDLGALNIYANGINSSGTIVGHFLAGRAFKWTEAGGIVELATSPYGGVATAINDAGEIAGFQWDEDSGYTGAVYWSAAGVRFIVGSSCGEDCAAAFAINKNGAIAGYRSGRPFTWSQSEGSQLISGVSGGYGDARAINDRGSVAGNIYSGEQVNRQWIEKNFAFLRTADGHYSEIRPPRGRTSLRMTGMNNNEQIVGIVQ